MTEAQYFPYLKYNWISDDPRVATCAQMLCIERAATNNLLRNRGLDLSDAFNDETKYLFLFFRFFLNAERMETAEITGFLIADQFHIVSNSPA